MSGWTHVRGQPIPDEVLALNGQSVTMGGFMIELDYDDDDQVVLYLLVESLWTAASVNRRPSSKAWS